MAHKKIMIVDDDSDIRFSVSDGLQMIAPDYEVVQAENGKAALDFLKKTYVDLIILDIMMPVMDGFELAEKIKQNPKLADIPIIFLSAKTDEYSKALGKMKGVDYIEKPFEILDLKNRVNDILG